MCEPSLVRKTCRTASCSRLSSSRLLFSTWSLVQDLSTSYINVKPQTQSFVLTPVNWSPGGPDAASGRSSWPNWCTSHLGSEPTFSDSQYLPTQGLEGVAASGPLILGGSLGADSSILFNPRSFQPDPFSLNFRRFSRKIRIPAKNGKGTL